jgi:predicted acetyltransferase
VRFVDREAAAESFATVYAAYAPTRAGELDRVELDFAEALGMPGEDDLKGRFYAVYEEEGRIDGYISYNVASLDPGGEHHPRSATIEEMCALTRASYIALWEFALGIDLVAEIRAPDRPIDEPVRWLLHDPRQLRTVLVHDRTWVRLVDVVTSLQGRRYPVTGSLVLGIHDDFCPWNTGTVRIEVDAEWGAATVEPVSSVIGEVDLELDVSVLGSLYLGGVTARQFAEAGRIVGNRAAVGLADRLFANDRPPFSLTTF